MRASTLPPTLRLPVLVAALLLSTTAPAWAVYKIVGPDGRVTFTDIPPQGGTKATEVAPGTGPAGDDAARLPPELQRIVARNPAVLYTTPHCPACDDARDLLRHRGIPFTEKTISSPEDASAYKQLSHGADRLPLLTLGSAALTPGFDRGIWEQALSHAGYPEASRLPPNYHWTPPAPLTRAASEAMPRPGPLAPALRPTEPPKPAPSPKAPPGFRF